MYIPRQLIIMGMPIMFVAASSIRSSHQTVCVNIRLVFTIRAAPKQTISISKPVVIPVMCLATRKSASRFWVYRMMIRWESRG